MEKVLIFMNPHTFDNKIENFIPDWKLVFMLRTFTKIFFILHLLHFVFFQFSNMQVHHLFLKFHAAKNKAYRKKLHLNGNTRIFHTASSPNAHCHQAFKAQFGCIAQTVLPLAHLFDNYN